MKTWYIMIHWDGPYVAGFISFGETPKQAITALKRVLWVKLVQARLKAQHGHDPSELSVKKIKAYFRTLKRPWRKTKKGYSVLSYTELTLPSLTGYWLTDIIRGQHYCNLPRTDNPAEVYWKKAEGKKN